MSGKSNTINNLGRIAVLCLVWGAVGFGATFDQAFNHAWNGPEAKGAKLYNHTWNIKKATVTYKDDHTILSGQISHRRKFKTDHQVYYNLAYRLNGTLYSAQVFVDGRWKELDRDIIRVLGSYYGRLPVTRAAQKPLSQAIIQLNPLPLWDGAAELIVAHFGIRAGAMMVNTPDAVLGKFLWAAINGPSYRNRLFNQEMTVYKAVRQPLGNVVQFNGTIVFHGQRTVTGLYQIELYRGRLSEIKLGIRQSNFQYTEIFPTLSRLLQPTLDGAPLTNASRARLKAAINRTPAPVFHRMVAQIAIHLR